MLETKRPTAFRFDLRSATREEHGALDEHPAFVALTAGQLDLEGYRRLMRIFHGLYEGLDETLDDASRRLLPLGCDFAYRKRQPLLEEDLRRLRIAPGRRAPPPAPYGSLAGLCGALYVVEGSVLGGAMLQRATGALLASSGGEGDGYWRWCRDCGSVRWAATCALIEASAETPVSRDEMVATARDTFRIFSDWFARWRDEPASAPTGMRLASC